MSSEIIFLSASKLKSYSACPARLKNEPFITKPATTFGDCVAQATAAYYTGGDFLSEYTRVSVGKELPEDHADRVKRIFRVLSDERRDLKINRDAIITVENREDYDVELYGKPFFQVPVMNGWGLRGAIDLADVMENCSLRITDHKTGMSQELDDLQLLCYAVVGRLKYGFEYVRTGFWYLEQGQYQYRDWRPAEIDGGLKMLDELAQRYIAEKDWPETPNKWCTYCTLKGKCKAFSEAAALTITEEEKPQWMLEPTIENAPKIFELLEQLEPRHKIILGIYEHLKNAQKELLQKHGAINAGGHIYTAREYTANYTYNLEKIFSLAAEVLQRMPFEVIKFDSGAYDKLITEQENPVIRKALSDIKDENKAPGTTAVRVSKKLDPDNTDAAKAKPEIPTGQKKSKKKTTVEEPSDKLPTGDAPSDKLPTGAGESDLVALCWNCGTINPADAGLCMCGSDSLTREPLSQAEKDRADILESLKPQEPVK